SGFGVLTGETGAGKSILIDALQLALGGRAESGVIRDGAARCEIAVEFETLPALAPWLEEQGFAVEETLLLRRTVDTEGRSRAWINGSAATAAQLKALAEPLVDIHGQHAWQSLTRAQAVRELLDAYAGIDTREAEQDWMRWREKRKALMDATERQASLQQESDRLSWQLGELEKLAPLSGEWEDLNARHARLANAQALLDAAQTGLAALDEADPSATGLINKAVSALRAQSHIEPLFAEHVEALEGALAQVQDTLHNLHQYTRHADLDPEQLETLDERISLWMSLARRYRRAPEDLADLLTQWKRELGQVGQALDLAQLQQAEKQAWLAFEKTVNALTRKRQQAAPRLSAAVTATMQTLGMEGGVFEVALRKLDEPQAHGWEHVEFLVAGHAGTTPKPVGKVASGGELSRIAL
ncbi:MAG: DNA repair protein RecN, partial [Comamonadaceae bacterium]|nr:DNA repair protein RecN [Comamonadaceae bacterium]